MRKRACLSITPEDFFVCARFNRSCDLYIFLFLACLLYLPPFSVRLLLFALTHLRLLGSSLSTTFSKVSGYIYIYIYIYMLFILLSSLSSLLAPPQRARFLNCAMLRSSTEKEGTSKALLLLFSHTKVG